jgi:sodium-dependent dicarboxylate transporter 2/3/5
MTLLSLIAAITGFAIVIHLGFSSATALAATLIPVVLGFLQGLDLPAETIWWIVLLTHVSINCGFILPVNSPQNMVAYATGTFNVWDFVRIGLPLALVAYIVLLVFSVTYWRWLGLSL